MGAKSTVKVKEIAVNEVIVTLSTDSQICIKRNGNIYPKEVYKMLSDKDRKRIDKKVKAVFHL